MSTKIITPTSIFLGLLAGWTAYWTVERMYVYSFPTPHAAVDAIVRQFMPSDATEEWKGTFGGAVAEMYAADREFYSRIVHVQLSGVMAICCLINLYLGDDVASLSAKERLTSAKASIHRFTGRIFQSCVIPWSLYLNYVLFVHGMMNFGPVIDSFDKICSIISTLSFGAGLCFITHSKNIQAHKFCMIVGSAALLFIPIQRLHWILAVKVVFPSVENFNGNLANYFKMLDATFFFAAVTTTMLGYVYAKENFADVKFKKVDAKKVE